MPTTAKWPSTNSISASAASSASAAIARALLDDRLRCAPDRGATHIGRARTAVSATHRDQIGIALAQPNQLVRNAEPIGQDLRKCRFVPLADGLRAGDQRYRAIGFEADVDVLVRRAAGSLDVIGKPKAAQQSACLAFAAPRREAGNIRQRERAIEGLHEIAAVHREAKRVGHRHRRRGNHVAATQFGAVEAALPRGRVDQPFDDVHRLGKARPARDADRRGVAQHRHDVQRDCRNRVDAALQMHILVGLHRAGAARHIGADIRHAADPQRQESARPHRAPAKPRPDDRAPGGRRRSPRCASRSTSPVGRRVSPPTGSAHARRR